VRVRVRVRVGVRVRVRVWVTSAAFPKLASTALPSGMATEKYEGSVTARSE